MDPESLGDILASALAERDRDWNRIALSLKEDGRNFEGIGVYSSTDFHRASTITFTVATLFVDRDDEAMIPVIKTLRETDKTASLLDAKQFVADGHEKTSYFRDYRALSNYVERINNAFAACGHDSRVHIKDVWKETLNV